MSELFFCFLPQEGDGGDNPVEFTEEEDIPPSMTNASMPTSTPSFTSAQHQEEDQQHSNNNNNHQGYNISLPPPDQTSTLCASVKVKTTADMRKAAVVHTITESYS